jgi:hypothetical protein
MVVIDWGDGSANTTLNLAAGVLTFGAPHQYLNNQPGNAPFTITVTVTDKDGGSGTGSTTEIVNNVAPANVTVTAAPNPVNEGGTVTLTGSFTDPGTLDTHTVVVAWGDGSADTINLPAGVLNFRIPHAYRDNQPGNAPFAISVRVTDQDGAGVTATQNQVVLNAPPVITALSATTAPGGLTTLTGHAEDPGGLDAHTVVIAWGDGSADTINLPAGAPGLFTAQHQYQLEDPRIVITVFVQDSEGARTQASTPRPPAPPLVVHDFISGLYRDVLFRGPDPGGFAFWTGMLVSGLMNREQIATQFLVSHERHGLVVDEFYRQILHRGSDAGGRQNWVFALDHGLTEADVVVQFVTSPEYQRSHPDNRSYALGLYQDLLLRLRPGELTTQELDFQQRALDFQVVTRARMALSFLFSDEAFVKAIHYDFNTFLRREPTPDNLSFFFASISRGFLTAMGLQARLLGSDEYFRMVTAP